MGRFPFGIPNGWFMMCFSDELAKGEVKRLHYFGRDLVLFRGESGAATVLDAYCAHMGAHLGIGGQVVGDTIRCPFHFWRYDKSGTCIKIPRVETVPPDARVRAWPVCEVNGLVLVWHDTKKGPPTFEIPAIPQIGADGWTRTFMRHVRRIRTCPQEIMENAVDIAHFECVHGARLPPNLQVEYEGPILSWQIKVTKKVEKVKTDDGADRPGNFEYVLEGKSLGLGLAFFCTNRMNSSIAKVMSFTPIDDEHTETRTGIIGKLDGRTEEEMTTFLEQDMALQVAMMSQDIPIWENKKYYERPVFCANDTHLPRFREWAQQFYSIR